MGRTKKVGATGRLGARYGASLRKRVKKIEEVRHATYKCPSCLSPKIQRQAAGIWYCRKCGYKFAGGAYIPLTARAKRAIQHTERVVAGE
ncbi:MAG: 50S ribosomal protein L37Ae [Candidatus Ranarchaeia archaeon]